MMHSVYVLRSDKDKGFYVGYASDLKGRFEAHTKGRVTSTKRRGLLYPIYVEICLDRTDAMRRERYLKTHHGKMYLHRRLKSYLTGYKIS